MCKVKSRKKCEIAYFFLIIRRKSRQSSQKSNHFTRDVSDRKWSGICNLKCSLNQSCFARRGKDPHLWRPIHTGAILLFLGGGKNWTLNNLGSGSYRDHGGWIKVDSVEFLGFCGLVRLDDGLDRVRSSWVQSLGKNCWDKELPWSYNLVIEGLKLTEEACREKRTDGIFVSTLEISSIKSTWVCSLESPIVKPI